MRVYNDRKNAQKKVYHSDRFYVAPSLPQRDVNEDEIFNRDVKEFEKANEIKKAYIEAEQLVLWIDIKDNVKTLQKAKELGYEVLSELSAVDFIEEKNGFEVFYQLLSMTKRKRMRVKAFIKKDEHISSVESVYKSANWAEREMYDMFGIIILNHPYMKRILMPDDWHGFPLLKSYPLEGDEEAKWYEIDTIFGKEYREVVGEEERNTSKVVEKDTFNFARLNHIVPKGSEPSKEEILQDYQEEGGIKIVKKASKKTSKIIKGRR